LDEKDAVFMTEFITEITKKVDVSKNTPRKDTLRWKYISFMVNSFWKNPLICHLNSNSIRDGTLSDYLGSLHLFAAELCKFLFDGQTIVTVASSSIRIFLPTQIGKFFTLILFKYVYIYFSMTIDIYKEINKKITNRKTTMVYQQEKRSKKVKSMVIPTTKGIDHSYTGIFDTGTSSASIPFQPNEEDNDENQNNEDNIFYTPVTGDGKGKHT
jgi:hypothetical protein